MVGHATPTSQSSSPGFVPPMSPERLPSPQTHGGQSAHWQLSAPLQMWSPQKGTGVGTGVGTSVGKGVGDGQSFGQLL